MNYNEIEILLVEDSLADAEMTIRALKKANIANKLVHLADGAQALDFIFCRGDFSERNPANKPKVILLDIKMPKVDGIEVLRQLKSNKETYRIPVVIMTSSNEDSDVLASYDLGVSSYVVKPVGFEGFAKAVNDLGLYWILINRVAPY
jgi:two-component system response regulator